MNTNNISKDGRLYVAACRVIDNFRYEHISKKPQNHVFKKAYCYIVMSKNHSEIFSGVSRHILH